MLNGSASIAAAAANAIPPSSFSFDPRSLEIKTKSIEATLAPLVQQISTLVNFKESIITGGKPKSERAIRAALKIGSAVEAAIERFVVVGETIADENPDIQPEMYDACQEARIAGSSIANLNSSLVDDNGQPTISIDKSYLVRAARQLLSSVTRVLLLADRGLVKHILRAEDKVAYSLTKLENTSNFTEFVKIFTDFGGEMVDLAHRSGDRQHDMKSEKRRAQLSVARTVLERYTMLLLTASKTLLRHPENQSARKCRDGVFHQMRLSLQLMGLVVTDGIMLFEVNRYHTPIDPNEGPLDIGMQLTASVAIKQLMEMLEMVRMTTVIGPDVRDRLVSALDSLCEMTQDFTDSAYTPHHQREQILDFLEECRFEMSNLIQSEQDFTDQLRNDSLEVTVERLNRRLKDLRKQLQVVAMDQISTIFRGNEDHTILTSIKTCSVAGDIDGVEKFLEKFREHAEHTQEVCRLLHHISLTDALHVHTGHAERNLRALSPLALLAGRTLCIHPSSRIARENLEVFCDTWAQNINDLSRLAKDLDAALSGRIAAEKQAYMSLPRPGVSPKPCMLTSSYSNVVTCGGVDPRGVSSSSDYCSDKSSGTSPGPSKTFGIGGSMPNMAGLGPKLPSPIEKSGFYAHKMHSPPVDPPGFQESDRSAFKRYAKSPPRTNPTVQPNLLPNQDPKPVVFAASQPGQPVILRQDMRSGNTPSPRDTPRAKDRSQNPKLRVQEREDEGNSSSGSACSEEKRNFEYRISLILDNLQLENETLKQLRVAHGLEK